VKFLLDHDVPAEIAHLLRYWEHNVTVLRTALPVTASDEEVFAHARSQGLILISCNRDHFLTLARQTRDHPGLIIPDPTQNAPLGMRPSIGAAPTRRREGGSATI
jgi:predicted nuclease of predicted toxin-antitoxin system